MVGLEHKRVRHEKCSPRSFPEFSAQKEEITFWGEKTERGLGEWLSFASLFDIIIKRNHNKKLQMTHIFSKTLQCFLLQETFNLFNRENVTNRFSFCKRCYLRRARKLRFSKPHKAGQVSKQMEFRRYFPDFPKKKGRDLSKRRDHKTQ